MICGQDPLSNFRQCDEGPRVMSILRTVRNDLCHMNNHTENTWLNVSTQSRQWCIVLRLLAFCLPENLFCLRCGCMYDTEIYVTPRPNIFTIASLLILVTCWWCTLVDISSFNDHRIALYLTWLTVKLLYVSGLVVMSLESHCSPNLSKLCYLRPIAVHRT